MELTNKLACIPLSQNTADRTFIISCHIWNRTESRGSTDQNFSIEPPKNPKNWSKIGPQLDSGQTPLKARVQLGPMIRPLSDPPNC